MGSTNFESIVWSDDTMETAYNSAVSEALYEDGSDPYNGTISTTDGVKLAPWTSKETPLVTRYGGYGDDVLGGFISERLDHLNKWEACEALRVRELIPAKTTDLGRLTVVVVLPAEDFNSKDSARHIAAAVNAGLAKRRRKAKREGVDSVLEVEPAAYGVRGTEKVANTEAVRMSTTYSPRVQVTSAKYVTKATKGKTETRYFVLDLSQRNQPLPEWERGHPSQAAARAALPETPVTGAEAYEVISMTRRIGGAGLVEHRAEQTSTSMVSLRVVAPLERVDTPEQVGERTGWLFYGWAAC